MAQTKVAAYENAASRHWPEVQAQFALVAFFGWCNLNDVSAVRIQLRHSNFQPEDQNNYNFPSFKN
eukprot:5742279-Amphidinium_carterae.1